MLPWEDASVEVTENHRLKVAISVNASTEVDWVEEGFSLSATKADDVAGPNIMWSKITLGSLSDWVLICLQPEFTEFINACSSVGSADWKLPIRYCLLSRVQKCPIGRYQFLCSCESTYIFPHTEKTKDR